MLDKSKLIAQLHKVADQLFCDYSPSKKIAQDVWVVITQDPLFLHKVRAVDNPPWPVPLWEADLGEVIPIQTSVDPYTVLSVDGSQIYPDRHAFLSCFLINTGSVILPYGVQEGRVELFSEPTIFAGVDEDGIPFTTDTVNGKRQELELTAGFTLAQSVQKTYKNNNSPVVLFDGSLIFWHLSSKEIEIRNKFLHAYTAILDQLYNEKIITAWYISLPKSKELMSLVRLYLCNFDPDKKDLYESVEHMVDSSIMEDFLPAYTRSIVFSNRSSITAFYPSHLKPFFFLP